MKKCTSCKEDKPLTEFNKKKRSKDGLQDSCKLCSRKRSRRYYCENKEKHRKVTTARKKKMVQKNQEYVWDWLSNHPCVDCGETDIVVLEFDHQKNKESTISRAVVTGWSTLRIQKEIDKCEVRCSNCHKKKTALDFKWKILKYLEASWSDQSRLRLCDLHRKSLWMTKNHQYHDVIGFDRRG